MYDYIEDCLDNTTDGLYKNILGYCDMGSSWEEES